MEYRLVSDDSGHDYIIPAQNMDEWYSFDFDDYDFELPDWAIKVEGDLTFESPRINGNLVN